MKEYKKKQIIKHALLEYIKRDGANKHDLYAEKRVLNEIEYEIMQLKEKYNIPLNDREKGIIEGTLKEAHKQWLEIKEDTQ